MICDTYWGSHGCGLVKGHEGKCFCCCACKGKHKTEPLEDGTLCVGAYPYYGIGETKFYGEDVETSNH